MVDDLYQPTFPEGAMVRIADRAFVENFLATWKYHHRLQAEQLAYANREPAVEKIGYDHGGDQLYNLVGIPGIWHERCLRAA
jgi:hypothetical protein